MGMGILQVPAQPVVWPINLAGRVGDSPIIGAGLFVDNEIGGATATGVGEEVVRTVGSFLVVELMRQGKSPQEACEEGCKSDHSEKT